MRIHTVLCALLGGLACCAVAGLAHAQAREEGRVLTASQVLEELRQTPDQSVPDRLLERAYGIAVIPDLTKVAFFAGGDRGHGVLVVRDKQGRFSNPVFVTMTGGSFGWQWGVELTDIVLVFTTPKGVEGINSGKVTLGADASVAAGPVGRQALAATDGSLKSEVYSYSRSRGVFAGLALDGSVISIDGKANAAFYHKPGVTAEDIIAGNVTSTDETLHRLQSAVATSTSASTQRTAASSGAATPAASTAGSATQAPAAKTSPASPPAAGTKAFPLADPNPGEEPN
jgi:lipid-binding SYLF domain-containing protein